MTENVKNDLIFKSHIFRKIVNFPNDVMYKFALQFKKKMSKRNNLQNIFAQYQIIARHVCQPMVNL